MSRPLSVAVNVDARQAQAGVKDLSAALDGAADALDDLARDAQRNGDRTERALDGVGDAGTDAARDLERAGSKAERALDDIGDAGTDAAREVKRSGDQMERTFRDMVRDAGKAETAVDKIGSGSKKSMSVAGEATGEFKDEALANFSEVTSSFDGSMSSIQDLVQGTLGGLASTGLPGIGLAAGAAAAGVGLVGAAFAGNAAEEEAAAARASTWADAYIQAGSRVIGTAQVVAEVMAIAADEVRRGEAETAGEDWGVGTAMAMRAMAGDATALAVVERTLGDRAAEATRLLAEQEKQTTASAGEVYDLADSVERGQASFERLNGDMAAGAAVADDVSDALKQIIADAEGASVQVDDFGNKLYDIPGGVQVVVDAETGRAHEDVSRFGRELDRTGDKVVAATVRVDVDDSAWRNWRPTIKRGGVQAYRLPGGNVASWE